MNLPLLLATIAWLAIPISIAVLDLGAGIALYRLWRPLKGAPGSFLLHIIMIGVTVGGIAQTLLAVCAVVVVLPGPSAYKSITFFVLYFASQVLLGGMFLWAVSRIRWLMTNNVEARLTIDIDSVIQFASPAVQNLFGYSPSELVGSKLTTLMAPEMRGAHEAAIQRYVASGIRRTDWSAINGVCVHRNGEKFPVLIALSEQMVGDVRMFTGAIRRAV